MSDKSTGLSRFWKELRRRNVLRSLAIYAGSAFIILEATTIIFPRWNFPDWSIDLVLWLLIVGVFINVIIAWFYDITPGGMQRTLPLEEVYDQEKAPPSKGWKAATYISVVVIVGLIVLNIVGGPKQLRAGDIQSIVILPFDNFTGDDELDYFVAGMHASLINDLGKLSGLRVICKTSASAFKDMDLTASEIAKELNVNAVIEGSIMCLDDSICSQFRLVNTSGEEKQIWTADYKEDRSQIINLYNQITKQIADEIMIELTPEEERLLAKLRTVDREAYDAYLRSYQYWDDLSLDGLNKGLEYLNLAIEKDPNWAPLYGALAQVWLGLAQMEFAAPEVAGPKIFEYLNKALELDPDFPDAHYTIAVIAVWQEWNWEKGEREFLKALELNPNDVWSRIFYSHLLWILKRYDEAHFHSQMAFELDPMNPFILALSSNVDQHGRIQQSLEKCKKALEIDPEHHYALLAFAEATYFNGDYKNSIETELKVWPGLDDEAREAIRAVFQDKGYVEAINTYLTYAEEYAKTNYISYSELGEYYYKVGKLEKSIECHIKAYELHDQMMPYITLSINGFDDLKDDPRIISIVEEMNLPFEAPE